MAKKKPASVKATAAKVVTNSALPASTGVLRVGPTQQTWSSRQLESMSKSRNRVLVSRFLQEQIPQLYYCINVLPKEAIGKGIGMKSISRNPDFKRDATALFSSWADSSAVDLRKESSFYNLQARWLSANWGEGECFIQKVTAKDEGSREWKLADKSKRRLQLQTILRDQLTDGDLKPQEAKESRWTQGIQYNWLDQLLKIRVNQDPNGSLSISKKYTDILAPFVYHLKDNSRFNQYHGDPIIYGSMGDDLLDCLDLKAIRKHAAKIRAALLGATTTRDGKQLNAMQEVMTAEMSGDPAADTGRRFMKIEDVAIMIPLSKDENMQFFQGGEAIPFKELFEQLIHPFVFRLGYPVEWIFSMGSLGGTASRAIIQKVNRAHQNLRALLQPFLQWTWEWVIGDAMMPGGPLYKYATVEDWNTVDFIADPDPSVDLGRDHKADMERLRANAGTMEDYIESRTGGSGQAIRQARINEKLEDIAYSIERGAQFSTPIPPAICTLLAIDPVHLQAMSGLAGSISPENLAAELAGMKTTDEAPAAG